MSRPGSPVLEVRVVSQIHGSLTVDLELELGCEIGILFGPSGAGKTTALRLIAGLARPQAGRVSVGKWLLFDSVAHIDEPLRNRQIGMIFQDDCLFPHLAVAANVEFGLKGWKPAARRSRLAEVSELCGIEHLLGRMPATLSGGERQRIGLARALAPRPRLLLCDEPVSALDLANRHALLDRLRLAQQTLAIPVLYVTHSPGEAFALGSRLFLLKAGRIVAAGAPLDVLSGSGELPAGADTWEGVRNVFSARVANHDEGSGASVLELEGGPSLIVPALESPPGSRVLVAVRADDILLSSEPVAGLSARNQIPGRVEGLVRHKSEAEVIVRTGQLTWIVSVVDRAVEQLSIAPGATVHLIVKARSCHVLSGDGTPVSR